MKINYKEYPEYMFAMIAAFLPKNEGHDLRLIAGNVVFRSEDKDGRTYKNGLLHSYDDMPAISLDNYKVWYKNGKIHREGDMPAIVRGDFYKEWYKNGLLHREGDLPAIISRYGNEWWKDGNLQRW